MIMKLTFYYAFFRSNASTDSGLKSSNNPSEEETHLAPSNHIIPSEHHHPRLFKKNTTVISCSHHKGLKCTQMTLARHYSLSSLLEALPAASVDADDLEKHASMSSLSSGSRFSDFDGYFYIWEEKDCILFVCFLENSTSYRIFSTKMVHFFHFWTKEESQFSWQQIFLWF